MLFSLLVIGCFRSGNDHPLMPEILRAEDHYSRMEPSKALEILKPMLNTDPQSLPYKYYDVRINSHLRALEFKQAFDMVVLWEERQGKKLLEKRRHVLISFIRNRATIPNPEVQVEAVKALGALRDKKMKRFIQEMFPESNSLVKLSISYSMALLGDFQRATSYLIERSQYGARNERFLASLYLIELDDLRLKDAYLKLLDDAEDAIRVLGFNVIGEKKIIEARERIQSIKKNTASWSIKILAAQALYRLGVTSEIKDLEEALNVPALQSTAQLLLAQIGQDEAIDQLKNGYSGLSEEAKSALCKLLIKRGHKDFVLQKSREGLRSLIGEVFEQKLNLELLGDLGSEEDFDILIPFMASPFEQVRVTCIWSMLKLLDRQILDNS